MCLESKEWIKKRFEKLLPLRHQDAGVQTDLQKLEEEVRSHVFTQLGRHTT